MSQSQLRDTDLQDENLSESTTSGDEQTTESSWNRVYYNNKGIFLILLAQVAGSSMDAIARYLQLGGTGMHPFQVRISSLFTPSIVLFLLHSSISVSIPSILIVLSYAGHFCTDGHDSSIKLAVHVVDEGSRLSFWQ
jgi:hypothetical protein